MSNQDRALENALHGWRINAGKQPPLCFMLSAYEKVQPRMMAALKEASRPDLEDQLLKKIGDIRSQT